MIRTLVLSLIVTMDIFFGILVLRNAIVKNCKDSRTGSLLLGYALILSTVAICLK